MADLRHTFSKEERICGKKDIDALLSRGKWCRCGVIKACIAPGSGEISRIMVSVPKRLFKRAVRRNLLKRRIREAYRLQKELLSASTAGAVNPEAGSAVRDILLQYNSPEVADFGTIKEDVAEVLRRAAK